MAFLVFITGIKKIFPMEGKKKDIEYLTNSLVFLFYFFINLVIF